MKESVVDQRIQDYFVLCAISNTKFLRAARHAVRTSYFGSEVTQNFIRICYNYFDQFNEAPGNHFRDELVSFLEQKKSLDVDMYFLYIDRLSQLDLPNYDYVISRINTFIQARTIESGAVELARRAKQGEFEQAKELMQKMLRSGITEEEVGLDYFDSDTPSYLIEHGGNERLVGFGMPSIDKRIPKGLSRTDFLCILGGYKGKKSFACIYFGLLGLMAGLKVLHVTHELSLEETEKRYDAGVCGMSLNEMVNEEEITFEIPEENGDFGELVKEVVPTVRDSERVLEGRRKLGRLGGQLIIRKYPMGQCSMSELERYLDYLERFEGFVPDILINDYMEKMQIPPNEKRNDAINDMYIRLKGIADERRLLAITVSQTTREALRRHKLSQQDLAEDIRKLGNVDTLLAISQTDDVAENNRMLLWVMANRTGNMDFGCQFLQNLSIGQFCIESWPLKSVRDKDRGDGGR
jgi:KaiC/GvpD/RAD55 family RecA-like ATPase